jgi:hypothetical protein
MYIYICIHTYIYIIYVYIYIYIYIYRNDVLHGGLSIDDRKDLTDVRFTTNGSVDVMLMSSECGKEGITLVQTNIMILMDTNLIPSAHDQIQVCIACHACLVYYQVIALNCCVHYLCFRSWVYVFYVGHIDEIMKPFSML